MIAISLVLLAAQAAHVDPPTLRILCLGDRQVAATQRSRRGWPETLAEVLGERSPEIRFEVENVALPGDTTVTALHRLRRDVLDRDPDVVVVQYGFTDAWVDVAAEEDFPRVAPGAFGSNLGDIVSTIDVSGALPILCQPGAIVWTDELRATHAVPPYDATDPWGLDRLLEAYARVVSDVAGRTRVPFVPVHEADRVRGHEILNSWRTDGIEPSSPANKWLAERIADRIEQQLEEGPLATPALSRHAKPSLGWTLPEIDLAGDASRVITVDREPGQYLGHPSTVRLEDGAILCAYPKGHGRGAIVLKRSTDGGRTWSERMPTPESWATSLETPVLFRIPTAAGRDNVILWSGLHPARRALSVDGGRTWGELEAVTPRDPWGGIVVMGDQATVRGGDTIAWFHDDGRFFGPRPARAPFTVFQTRTQDGGVTWSKPHSILTSRHGNYCEPGVVRSGGRMALLLRENSRRRNSAVIFSDDEGVTWSEPRPLAGALTGDRHQVLTLPDGRLFISFRDMGLQSPRRGDWVAWVGSFEDLESGSQGQLRLRLMDNLRGTDCAYPALELLEGPREGESEPVILAVTYGHWTAGEEAWLAGLRIPIGELIVPR